MEILKTSKLLKITKKKLLDLLGRRLADPTVLETLGVNFRQPAGPKARLYTPHKNDIFCDQSRGYFPHIWEFLALISADFLIV